jgi:threonine dehydrogenase-like Zn-dependent dehydrogenase
MNSAEGEREMLRRVACIDGYGRGVCQENEVAELAAGQVLVEVEASLISPGTELGGCRTRRENPEQDRLPRPFGYANAGRVKALGGGVEQFAIGQRVACMGAGYALHADYACVPQNLCAAVPDGVEPEEAAFAHLAATALHAIRRAAPVFGENAVVMGLGLVGNLASQFAELSGGYAVGVDRLPLRLEKARTCGISLAVDAHGEDPVASASAFSGGRGMDYGVIAFGGDATEAFKQVRGALKVSPDGHHMGRIVIVGGAHISHAFAAGLGNVDVRSAARTGPGYHDEAYEHGESYPPVFVDWPTQRNLDQCLRAIANGRLKVRPLITHEIPLNQVGRAVDLLVESPGDALGVVLRP